MTAWFISYTKMHTTDDLHNSPSIVFHPLILFLASGFQKGPRSKTPGCTRGYPYYAPPARRILIESMNESQSIPSRDRKSTGESAQHGEPDEGCVREAREMVTAKHIQTMFG